MSDEPPFTEGIGHLLDHYGQARAEYIHASLIVKKRHDRMASMLRRLEHLPLEDEGALTRWCPVCHLTKTEGHSPTCDLHALLKEIP